MGIKGEITHTYCPSSIVALDMKVGQVGVIPAPTLNNGAIVFRASTKVWVNLTNGETWSGYPDKCGPMFPVRLLPTGTKITIEVNNG